MSSPHLDPSSTFYDGQYGNFEITCDLFDNFQSDDDNTKKNEMTVSAMEQENKNQTDIHSSHEEKNGKYRTLQLIQMYEQPLEDNGTVIEKKKRSQTPCDEEELSEKMSQLSSSLLPNKTTKPKKMSSYMELNLQELIGIDIDQVPDCLCRNSHSFEKLIAHIRPKTNKNDVEQLRHIVILMYRLLLLEKLQCLWRTYRKSGLGELLDVPQHIQQAGMKIWPNEIRTRIKNFQIDLSFADNHCQFFVDHCLKELDTKNRDYSQQLRYQTTHLLDYTSSMEETFQNFVQQGFFSQSLDYDCQIELVQYHYIDAVLKQQYLNENPNENQVQLLKCLSKLKYEEAITKYEWKYLQKEPSSENSTFNSLQTQFYGQLSMIDGLHNVRKREQLYREYIQATQQAKTAIMKLSLETAEEQMHQCQKRFNIKMNQIWSNENQLPLDQRLTPRMIYLIEQRLANIDARLECIHKYKLQLSKLEN